MSKEYVFVGNAQNKTRDFIKQLIKENKELKNRIKQLMNNEIPTNESLVLSQLYDNQETVSLDEILNLLEYLQMDNIQLREELNDVKKDLEENYRPISLEDYGISNRDFI